MSQWLVIPCFTEWENQGNTILYQVSPQISMCQRLHLRYQFTRDAVGPRITDHGELLDLTIARSPEHFPQQPLCCMLAVTVSAFAHWRSSNYCLPQNLKYARDFLSKLQMLTHLIITTILSSKYYYVSPFTNEAEARGYIICPRL